MSEEKTVTTKNEPELPVAEDAVSDKKKISGKAKKRKSKWTDVFVGDDMNKVKSYIFRDVIIPNIKDLIRKIVTNGIDMILYNEVGGSSKKGSTISRPSYSGYYKNGDRDRSPSYSSKSGSRYAYSDVILEERAEAEDVIRMLDESCQMYDGFVSVGDLYDMVGLDHKYTDNKYGWTRAMLRDADVVRVPGEGYLLKFPRPVPLD